MIEAGLPIPRLQHEFRDANGKLVARTDYDWEALLVGEFDGDVKYRKDLEQGRVVGLIRDWLARLSLSAA
jgi:hypothetical protein